MNAPGILPVTAPTGPAHDPRPVLIALFLLLFFPSDVRSSRPAFDYISTLSIPPDATLIARGDFNGDGIPDLIAAGARAFSVYLQGRTSFSWTGKSGKLDAAPSIMATGRVNADVRDDLVMYTSDPPAVSIYLSGKNGIPVFRSSFAAPGDIGKMIVADLDGDGSSDILLFGKKTPGIEVFAGDGGGKFVRGPVLHPDVSISLAAVTRLDDDELPDLVAVNWISNEVLVSSGFGQMNFSDPYPIPCDQEPVALAVGDLNGDGTRDIVAGYGERPGFSIMGGDGSGTYSEYATREIVSVPARIRIGDVDGDGMNDLLIFTPEHGAVAVRYFDRTIPFSSGQVFSTGADTRDVIFFLDAGKKHLNAAVLPKSGSGMKILHNRTSEYPETAGWDFVTGTEPGGIEFADLNSDNWTDVILAQGADPAVNIFMNNGRGNLLGMVSLPVPGPARDLLPVGGSGSGTAYLTTGIDDRTLTYVNISGSDLTGDTRSVRTERVVSAIDATHRGDPAVTRIYASRGGGEDAPFQLSAFDVRDNNRFEEIDLPLPLGGGPLATLSADINRDGLRDFVVVSPGDTAGRVVLRIFLQTPDGFTPDRSAEFDLGGGENPPIRLWTGDLDSDGYTDFVFNTGRPFDRLWISLAVGDSAFSPAIPIMDGVRIPARQGLTIVDFNSDSVSDLVFVNEKTRTIQFLPGDGRGEFSGPVNLMSAKGAKGIGVADINRDSEQELLVSGREEGTLTITTFHHPLFERRKK